MRSIFIDTLGTNLQLHDNQTVLDFWVQSPIEGLESPDYRMTEYDKPGEDGGVVSGTLYSSRSISLKGIIKGATPAIYEANRRLLGAACSIVRDNSGYPAPKRISFTTVGGSNYYVDGFFRKPVFAHEEVKSCHFLLQFKSPNPAIFGGAEITSGAIVRASGGGFILPVILPIVSTSGTGGSAVLTNDGAITSYPILTLTGPLTNPFILNATSGKLMQLNYALAAGDIITINMLEKTILLNDSSNILSSKTSDSDWWGIEPGANIISFSTGSTADTGNLQITYNNAYVGI